MRQTAKDAKRAAGGNRRAGPLRILANIYAAQKASRDMTGGVLRYAATHPDVEVRLYGLGAAHRQIEELREWKPDGIIISADDPKEIRRIERSGCRGAVFVNVEPPAKTALRCGSVFCDGAAVAMAAADLFARKRLGHFAFAGTLAGEQWSAERGEALRKCAARAGATFDVFNPPKPGRANRGQGSRDALAQWLSKQPKPCGVFAANDLRAKDVIDACRAARVPVPQQVLVLGVDDEEFICRQVQPTLSSVVPDFDRGGYVAAETLVELLRGHQKRIGRRLYGVRGVVERISTSDPNDAGRMAVRAEEFIREHATTPGIRVADVARAAFVSVRLLEKNFKSVTGTTVCEAIQAVRLRRVCSLLEETETPIGQIGELSGFENDGYLKRLFRSRFGSTMRAFRIAHRAVPNSEPLSPGNVFGTRRRGIGLT